ncbi:hypothetical protein CBER1_01156 [Cercospora berteroae]|uniref:Uncharacterized protein n=1 Tax=Cercospora berteroae TaxID=357750 RepID=A0A2S6CIM9_9PEZI|nr:hypothetical protein CBER1_01156 [Cercospora berteroae]
MPGSAASGANGADVPPLAVYHICRVCLRQRSARYHRENPIPINGMAPPPGVCRRCQSPARKGRGSIVEIVEESRSNDIRIGIASFVPNAEYTTNTEARQRRARRLLTPDDWQEIEVIYTEREATHAAERNRERHIASVEIPKDHVVYKQVRGPTSSTMQRAPRAPDYVPALPPPPPPPSSTQNISTRGSARVAFETIEIPPPPPPADVYDSGPVHAYVPSKTSQQDPSGRATSSERVLWTREIRPDPQLTQLSESEIRKLAREEVVRYRQAERRVETHADPYAHGRMVEVVRVPVERRIVQEKDDAVNEPWMSSKKRSSKDSNVAPFSRETQQEVISVEVSRRDRNRESRSNSTWDKEIEVKAKESTAAHPSVALSEKTRWLGGEARRTAANKLPADQREDTWRYQDGKGEFEAGAQYQCHATENLTEQHLDAPADRRTQRARASGTNQGSRSGNNDDRGEREYEYRRRTVTPLHGRIPHPDEAAEYFREATEFLHRRKGPGASPTAPAEKNHVEEIRRRISDASSRVHFSKKLDFSPTPPDSDASSSDFRGFAVAADIDELRGAEMRPTQRIRSRTHRQSEVPDVTSGPDRVLSESPSREQFRRAPNTRNIDGYGPYVREVKRSASVDVEDGSTVASVSRSGREHSRHEGRRGVR